jgi:hypothetical protein
MLEQLLSTAALVMAETCPYRGGWGLRTEALKCLPDAPNQCSKGLQNRCCPLNLDCAGDGIYNDQLCCPSGTPPSVLQVCARFVLGI